MNKFAYVHSYVGIQHHEEYHVYQGLILNEFEQKWSHDGRTLKKAVILFIDQTNGIRIETCDHIKTRISAVWFVHASEFELLRDNILGDWSARQCWKEAYEDMKEIELAIRNNCSV